VLSSRYANTRVREAGALGGRKAKRNGIGDCVQILSIASGCAMDGFRSKNWRKARVWARKLEFFVSLGTSPDSYSSFLVDAYVCLAYNFV